MNSAFQQQQAAAGVADFLADVLVAVQESFVTRDRKSIFVPIVVSDHQPEPSETPFATDDTNNNNEISSDNKLVDNIPQGASWSEPGALAAHYNKERQKDDLIDTLELLQNAPQVDDESRLVVTTIVWLCSWAYEEHPALRCSILTANNNKLLIALLQSIDLSDLRNWFDYDTSQFIPGVRATLETLCILLLRARGHEQEQIAQRIIPTIEAVLQRTSTAVIDKCGPLAHNWTPSMASFATIHAAMLAAVYVGGGGKKRKRSMPLSEESFTSCVNVCQTMVDGYAWSGCAIDPHVMVTCVLISMGILSGGFEYARASEVSRILLPLPDPRCGSMATLGRWLVDKFCKDVKNNEGCVVVMTFGSLVISRAQKAAALVVKENTVPDV